MEVPYITSHHVTLYHSRIYLEVLFNQYLLCKKIYLQLVSVESSCLNGLLSAIFLVFKMGR
jgi:hypothetical protein